MDTHSFWGHEIQHRTNDCVEAVENLIFELQFLQFNDIISDSAEYIEDIK